MTRTYKLYWTNTGSANAAVQTAIRKGGIIRAVLWDLSGLGGASITGVYTAELTRNSAASQVTVNDTGPFVLSYATLTFGVGVSASSNMNLLVAGLAIRVEYQDTFYVNTLLTNTAPASMQGICMVYVDEDN